MKDDSASYFDSQEFIDLLDMYENMLSDGGSVYFDSMDIANIAEYYTLSGDLVAIFIPSKDSESPEYFPSKSEIFVSLLKLNLIYLNLVYSSSFFPAFFSSSFIFH